MEWRSAQRLENPLVFLWELWLEPLWEPLLVPVRGGMLGSASGMRSVPVSERAGDTRGFDRRR